MVRRSPMTSRITSSFSPSSVVTSKMYLLPSLFLRVCLALKRFFAHHGRFHVDVLVVDGFHFIASRNAGGILNSDPPSTSSISNFQVPLKAALVADFSDVLSPLTSSLLEHPNKPRANTATKRTAKRIISSRLKFIYDEERTIPPMHTQRICTLAPNES